MVQWKTWTLSCIIFLIYTTRECCAMERSCKWLMDVLEMLSEPEKEFRLYYNAVHPGRSFFLRIRIACQGQVNPFRLRSLVYSGYTPRVKLEVTKYGQESLMNTRKILYVSGAFVQFNESSSKDLKGNFLVWNNSTFDANHMDINCTQMESRHSDEIPASVKENLSSPHCRYSRLCNVAWVVPVSVEDSTVLVKCSLTNPDVIEETKHNIHASDLNKSNGNRIGEYVRNLPNGYNVDQAFSINRLALPIPLWVVAAVKGSDYCLLTDSEFKTSSLIKFGLQEIRATPQNFYSEIVLSLCIGKMVAPPQSFPGTINVLAIEQTSTSIFEAEVQQGTSLHFSELKDAENRTLCEFIGSELNQDVSDCVVQDGSSNSIPLSHFVFLVSLGNASSVSYYIVTHADKKWRLVFKFPSSLEDVHKGDDDYNDHLTLLNSSIVGSIPICLRGLTYSRNTGNNLFAWGNVLLYSPNGGEEFVWLWDIPHDSTITVFDSADDGSYALLTESQQVWWGNIGTSRVRLLEEVGKWNIGLLTSWKLPLCLENYNILSLFFDTSGDLWKIIQCNNRSSSEPCIFRAKVPISDLLSNMQLIHEQTFHRVDVAASPEMETQSQYITNRPERCLRPSIVFSASHSNYYTRHIIDVVETPDLVNTIPVSFEFLSNYQGNMRASMRGTNTVADSKIKDVLPAYVYLKKGDFYSFGVMMILDSSLPTVTINKLCRFIIPSDIVERMVNNINGLSTLFINDKQTGITIVQPTMESVKIDVEEPLAELLLHQHVSKCRKVSSVSWSALDDLRLSYRVSDIGSLDVSVVRNVFSHKGTVFYQFSLRDSGIVRNRNAPGIGLHPVEFRLQPWQSDKNCVIKETGKGVLRGIQSMTFLLGCPPGIKVVFDAQASLNASEKNHFCELKDGIPCFLFDYTFNPVFKVLDQATGNTTQFSGAYLLAIVGGGKDLDSLVDYSEGDRALFNYENEGSTSTLIWTPAAKDLGSIPVFNISTNGLQWLCGRNSPCSEISPVFPHSPEFYFKLEFSNRDMDGETSNCDLTTRFVIRIHGLPLGSLYPATVIVMTCIGILTSFVLTTYAFTRKDRRLWNLTCAFVKSKREIFENWLRNRFGRDMSRVGDVNETSSVKDHDTEVKKEV